METDPPIPARGPNQMLINKKKKNKYRQVDFVANKGKQKDRQIHGPCQRSEKAVEHEGKSNTNCSWHTWNGPEDPREGTVGIGNQWKNQNHLDLQLVLVYATETGLVQIYFREALDHPRSLHLWLYIISWWSHTRRWFCVYAILTLINIFSSYLDFSFLFSLTFLRIFFVFLFFLFFLPFFSLFFFTSFSSSFLSLLPFFLHFFLLLFLLILFPSVFLYFILFSLSSFVSFSSSFLSRLHSFFYLFLVFFLLILFPSVFLSFSFPFFFSIIIFSWLLSFLLCVSYFRSFFLFLVFIYFLSWNPFSRHNIWVKVSLFITVY